MTIYGASQAAQKPGTDHVARLVEEVRQAIAAEQWVLSETRHRRERVLTAAKRFLGALDTFGSGSLAHGTVNNPISDGDGGVVLNRQVWFDLGPDGRGVGPEPVMVQIAEFVVDALRDEYPKIAWILTKRAILFEFHAPMDDEDPSVDLVICLTRRDAPGYWIPNREKAGWDPSNPRKHTQLMTANPKDLRVHRARVIRLIKAAITQHDPHIVCPWNISAQALKHVKQITGVPEAVAELLHRMAFDIAQGDTPDPAGVAAPIKLPEETTRQLTVATLQMFASKLDEALAARDDGDRVLELLADVWPEQLRERADEAGRRRLNRAFQTGGVTAPGIAHAFGHDVAKSHRSYGDAG